MQDRLSARLRWRRSAPVRVERSPVRRTAGQHERYGHPRLRHGFRHDRPRGAQTPDTRRSAMRLLRVSRSWLRRPR